MSKIQLELNLTIGYTTVEEARHIGQAIDVLVNSTSEYKLGYIHLKDIERTSGRNLPLVKPTPDRSTWVVGGQEAEEKATKFAKIAQTVLELDTLIYPEEWAEFARTSRKTGTVDNDALATLITREGAHIEGLNEIVVENYVAQIYGVFAQQTIARELATARAAEKRKSTKGF